MIADYARPDNPVFIPETMLNKDFGPNFFYALGHGAIGFSPFGVDYTDWTITDDKIPAYLSENFALIGPMQGEIARLNLEGKLQTAVERKGMPQQRLHFPGVDAVVSFGFPQRDGEMPPGTADDSGRAMVAQLGPLDFLVTGFEASVSFELAAGADAKPLNQQAEILRAEEGKYVNGAWQPSRIWNGDQTDRGLQFRSGNTSVVRIQLHRLPLYVEGAKPSTPVNDKPHGFQAYEPQPFALSCMMIAAFACLAPMAVAQQTSPVTRSAAPAACPTSCTAQRTTTNTTPTNASTKTSR